MYPVPSSAAMYVHHTTCSCRVAAEVLPLSADPSVRGSLRNSLVGAPLLQQILTSGHPYGSPAMHGTNPILFMQLSLFKPERRGLGLGPASPAASVASGSSQPSSPQAEDRPKRSLSRSGSTRMLSLENLQKAGQSPPDAHTKPIQVCTCYLACCMPLQAANVHAPAPCITRWRLAWHEARLRAWAPSLQDCSGLGACCTAWWCSACSALTCSDRPGCVWQAERAHSASICEPFAALSAEEPPRPSPSNLSYVSSSQQPPAQPFAQPPPQQGQLQPQYPAPSKAFLPKPHKQAQQPQPPGAEAQAQQSPPQAGAEQQPQQQQRLSPVEVVPGSVAESPFASAG